MNQSNLFEHMDEQTVRQLIRHMQPRTIHLMRIDCERSTDPRINALVDVLTQYLNRAWPDYQFTPLPQDPWFTVDGRFRGTYTAEEYGRSYMNEWKEQTNEE